MEQKLSRQSTLFWPIGALCGLCNGLFGAGGGIIAVSLLKRAGLPPKKAHATSLLMILPISAVSACMYWLHGSVSLADTLPYLPGGIIGAVAGAFSLPHIPDRWLRRIFGVLLLYAAVRLWTR